MPHSLLATPCRDHAGRRLALLGGTGPDDARILGPGLPEGGLAVADLPVWGDHRPIFLTETPGSWKVSGKNGEHLGELTIAAWPPVPDTVHLVPFGHSDFGWADLPDRMRALFVQDLDLAIAGCEATAHRPEGERFVWNVEIAALVSDWLAARSPAQHRRLVALIADGRIEIGALTANIVLAACDPGDLERICARAQDLAGRLGGQVASAHHIDIPGLHPRLPESLVAAGVEFLTWGANSQYSLDHDTWLPRCFRWRPNGGPGIQIWRHTQDPRLGAYASGGAILRALEHSPAAAAVVLARWLGTVDGLAGLSEILVGLGADFARPVPAASDLVRWWNANLAAPRIRLSTNVQAHRAIAAAAAQGHPLPELTGQIPDAWISLGLGVPDLASLARRSALALRRAEQIAVWRRLAGGGASGLDAAAVSEGILRQHEHTMGLEGRCDRYLPEQRDDILQNSGPIRAADEALRLAAWQDLSALGRRLGGPTSAEGPVILVLNHLAIPNTGVATARVHVRHLHHRKGWQVRDLASGRLVPHQTDRPLVDQANYHQTTVHHLYDLQFLATEVPALGYARYRLEATDEPVAAPAATTWTPRPGGEPAARLAWAHGELDVDPATGAILAWRQGGRSWLPEPGRSGPLLGECQISGFALSCATPKDFTDNDRFYRRTEVYRPRLTRLQPLTSGPVSGGYIAEAELGNLAKLTLRVRTYAHAPHLDLEIQVERTGSLDVEALALAVPAAVGAGVDFTLDAGGRTTHPLRDTQPGCFRDGLVADRWAAVHGSAGAVVLASPEAPVVSMGGMDMLTWRRAWPETLAPELWTILSLNGHWKCGNLTRRNRESTTYWVRIAAQADYSEAAAQAVGDGIAFPLTAELVEDSDGDAPDLSAAGSFLQVEEGGQTAIGVQVISLRPTAAGLHLCLAERLGRDRRLAIIPGPLAKTGLAGAGPDGRLTVALAADAQATIRIPWA